MKKLFSLTLIVLLIAALAIPVFAADGEPMNYVIDTVGLISDSEFYALEARAEDISDQYELAVRIVIVDDYTNYGSGAIWDVAEHIFFQNDLGYGNTGNGVMLLLSMDERDFDLRSFEDARDVLTDYGILQVEDAFLPDLGNNNWYLGFSHFLDAIEEVFESAADGEVVDGYVDYDYYNDTPPTYTRRSGVTAGRLAAILGIPSAIAGIFCGTQSAKMKSVHKKHDASQYIQPDSMNLTVVQDIFTHTTQTRVKIESSSGSSGGGGGFHSSSSSSGHSGKF